MPLREFTSFDVAAVVRELKEKIIGSRVNNIYQLNVKTVAFKLHQQGETAILLILEAGKTMHLTNYSVKTPSTPSQFCVSLRKYLRNAVVADLVQHEFERVIVLSFKSRFGNYQLVIELFGDGNIILLDPENRIQQALSFRRMRDRNILRGEIFVFAPPIGKNPITITLTDFVTEIGKSENTEIVRILARLLGLGGVYAEETLLISGVEKSKASALATNAELTCIYGNVQALLSYVTTGTMEPCIVMSDGTPIDVTPFRLLRYEKHAMNCYSSYNEALDEFYSRASLTEEIIKDTKNECLKRERERLTRIANDQRRILSESEGKADLDRQSGDLIYAHIPELQNLIDKFAKERQAGGSWEQIATQVASQKSKGEPSAMSFESFDPRTQILTVKVDNLRVNLNVRKTLFANGTEYYERSKRNKQRIAGAKTALEDTYRKLAEIQAKIGAAEIALNAAHEQATEKLVEHRVKTKQWYEKFRWFVSSEGFLVVGGKDAVSNEVLIKKHTEERDIVFHADIVGAPFVVIKTQGKEPTQRVLDETAEFAASYSRAWREGFASVDVYWVYPSQLSKAGPSGESVPHGAFTVLSSRNWMRGVILRLAIGVVTDDVARFVGGPIEAVKSKTDNYVGIAPGNVEGKDLFTRVLSALGSRVCEERREKVIRTSSEQLREFVPYQRASLLRDKES